MCVLYHTQRQYARRRHAISNAPLAHLCRPSMISDESPGDPRRRQLELTRVRQDAAPEKTAKFHLERQCLEPRPARGVGQGTFSMPLGGGSQGVLGSTLFSLGAFDGPVPNFRRRSNTVLRPAAVYARRMGARHSVAATFLSAKQDRGSDPQRQGGQGDCDRPRTQQAHRADLFESRVRAARGRGSSRAHPSRLDRP